MQIIHTIAELRLKLASHKNIGLVTTMGNLHSGHIHLVNLAKQQSDCVVVSIFVNPLQFGANEDLAAYPRTLDEDCKKLDAAGVDIVFAPTEREVYPIPQTMTVVPPAIADQLCGTSRPGHFSGVATVVLKLFNIVRPDIAVFGKKDFQQLFIIRQLVSQFNLPIEIVAGETVREEDGLAMSSRNGYLNPAERLEAQRLSRALKLVVDAVRKKKLGFAEIESQTTQYLTQLGWIVDYISIRHAQTLLPPSASDAKLVVLGAARLGKTRLIDNIEFDLY